MTRALERISLLPVMALAVMLVGCNDGSDDDGIGDPPMVAVSNPYDTPTDPLTAGAVESCDVYQNEVCEAGALKRCSVYDTAGEAFVDPDPLLRRVLLYDRWYDLHGSPDGLTGDRRFTEAMPGTTPESEWANPTKFAGYDGMGDAAIWTGTALNSVMMRYLVTGTEADYQRFEQKVRDSLRLFDVTGIRGYLARYFYSEIPVGNPLDPERVFIEEADRNHTHNVMEDPDQVEGLSPDYLSAGTPGWNGSPSIDQYSGMTMSMPAAYNLLRDQDLKAKMADHLTCYLKRLRRIDIINIQENDDLIETIQSLVGGGNSILDPDDPQLDELDSVTMYYTPQPNELNWSEFDRSCPDTVTTVADRIIDATDSNFEIDLLELAGNLEGKAQLRRNGIDHYYMVNARGQDTVHLMNLAVAAYHMTGDDQYLRFLEDTIIDELDGLTFARTFMGVVLPKWCRKYYEVNISVAPLWGLLNLLDDSVLKTTLQEVMFHDVWELDTSTLGNARFAMMFGQTVPASIGTGQQDAIDDSVARLRALGGNDGVLEAPRRDYNVDFQDVTSGAPEIDGLCPTEEQVAGCEAGVIVFGIPFDARPITEPCTGAANECVMEAGCVGQEAATPLPMGLRPWADFVWQRSPFEMGKTYGRPAMRQSPGLDLTEPYWIARKFGYIGDGDGQVLAWEDAGTCP